jgi:large subunit ribosomal protein L28
MFPTPPILASLSKVSTPFRRSQLGLFHGKTKQYGNNVPHSKHKTRRTWLPNVHTKRLTSDALGHDVKVKLTTRALKSINKVGVVCSSWRWFLIIFFPLLLLLSGVAWRR